MHIQDQNKYNNVLNIIQQYLGGAGGGVGNPFNDFWRPQHKNGELHRNKNVAFCTRPNASTLFLNIF